MVCFSSLGFEWTLIDRCYIKDVRSQLQVQEWRKFLSSFGVLDFLAVKQQDVTLTSSELVTIYKRVFDRYNWVVFQIRPDVVRNCNHAKWQYYQFIIQGMCDRTWVLRNRSRSVFPTLSLSLAVCVVHCVVSKWDTPIVSRCRLEFIVYDVTVLCILYPSVYLQPFFPLA